MAGRTFALLVGIDRYQAPVSPLEGCVADIETWHDFLESRVGAEGGELHARVLRNEEATRQAVIDQFLSHLGQAGPEDTALFCYSGHGSQCRTAPEFHHLEPDRLDETLVCYDSRQPGNYDLADKEMAKLIAAVAERGAHVVLVLDSCHSGSATRNLAEEGGARVRRVPTDDRQRPVSSYLVTPGELGGMAKTRSATGTGSGWVQLPKGRHVVLSACQSNEEAKEDVFDGQQRGVFSHYLMETLQNAQGAWTYRDLFARVTAMVKATVSRQSPVIEATEIEDLDRPFLGGAVRPCDPYFTLSFDDRDEWVMDGGTVHGIAAVQPDDTTVLAVFPVEAMDLQDTAQAIGEARVTERQAVRSKVEFTLADGTEPDSFTIYKAVVIRQPVAALGVRLEGDAGAVQRVRDELAAASSGGTVQVREVQEGGELRLLAVDDCYRVSRSGDDRPLFAEIQGWADNAGKAVEHLEHVGRWIRMANLDNATSRLPNDAVSIECYRVAPDGSQVRVDAAGTGSALRLHYEYRDGEWRPPMIRLKVTNNSRRELHCMLFDLTDEFSILSGLIPDGGVRLEPGEEAWISDGNPEPVQVPDDLWRDGMTEYTDLVKVVACTEKCDARRFEQGRLGVRYRPPTTRSAGMNSLEALMQSTMTRVIGGGASGGSGRIADWVTAELGITTVRPLEGAQLPDRDGHARVTDRVMVNGHGGLQATLRLATVPQASRDLSGAPALPAWLRDDPERSQAFDLSPTRGVEGGLSVLELSEVSGHESVTPDDPLTLDLKTALAPGEHLLTIGWDAENELYLPLGRSRRSETGVEVRIERLPAPVTGTRSLTGSIKIFFRKIISEKLGRAFEYPLLQVADETGYVTADTEEVRARVAASSKILLFIHGITGDTRGMVKSAFHPGPGDAPTPVGTQYDLVLAYDYENLNTPVQANARALKERLEAVGLGPDHGKTLHIAAHSMGGLVSRWFVEHLGGNEMVEHLVMLGTPNGGSPWPSVEEWAAGAIGMGLNGLSGVFWPAEVLGGLLEKFESAVSVSLEQMQPGSELLEDLSASPDPGVRYSVLAGNTSLIGAALGGEGKSRLQRLFEKLNLQGVLHATASLAFFGEPNDVAVSVESITSVPDFGKLDGYREVDCDHMSYFTTEAGLGALGEALS